MNKNLLPSCLDLPFRSESLPKAEEEDRFFALPSIRLHNILSLGRGGNWELYCLSCAQAYQISGLTMSSPVNLVMKQVAPTSDNERSRQRVNSVQKQELVRLMKANFLFIERKHAVVRGELSRAEVWRMITARLNSLGPPMLSTEVWQKVSIFEFSCYCALKSICL